LKVFRTPRSAIYKSVAKLGSNEPVGLTHRRGVMYHEVPFRGLRLEYSRTDMRQRVQLLSRELSLDGSHGLDLGCAVGGLTFSLQKRGASMVGVERDGPSYEVAMALENKYRTGAGFIHSDIVGYVSRTSEQIRSGLLTRFDFVLLFSAFNWVVEGMSLDELEKFLGELGELSNLLVMDSAVGGKGQPNLTRIGVETEADFEALLLRGAGKSNVRKIGTYDHWYGRGIFLFETKGSTCPA